VDGLAAFARSASASLGASSAIVDLDSVARPH
jgi:hypothetical protein